MHQVEQNLAVAAASILARAWFLEPSGIGGILEKADKAGKTPVFTVFYYRPISLLSCSPQCI
jgi:hypothetical protein